MKKKANVISSKSKLILAVFVGALSVLFFKAQTPIDSQVKSDIRMRTLYGSSNPEIQELLTFENIDKYKVEFTGDQIKGKNYSLIVKKLWDGKVTEIDTIINTSKIEGVYPIDSSLFEMTVSAKKISNNKLKVFFRFPDFGIFKMYDAIDSYDYSFRDTGTNMDIKLGKPFPAFAYILPYETNGVKRWCAVEKSGKNVENWGKDFGIKHYLIFEMLFE